MVPREGSARHNAGFRTPTTCDAVFGDGSTGLQPHASAVTIRGSEYPSFSLPHRASSGSCTRSEYCIAAIWAVLAVVDVALEKCSFTEQQALDLLH
jgi:hypothetical protein